jgi:hypothetical protein
VSDIDRERATQVRDRTALRDLRAAFARREEPYRSWARQTGEGCGPRRLSNRVPFDKFSC